MNCSEMIKDIRSRLGLSQMELAEQLEVTFATVNRWENGRSKPASAAMQKLEDLCRRCNLQIVGSNGEDRKVKETYQILLNSHGKKKESARKKLWNYLILV